MIKKWVNRVIGFVKELVGEFSSKGTLILFAVVVAVMYCPVWGGYLLYAIFKWKWCFAVASAALAFWAGPFTPFFPLCIAITHFLEKIIKKDRKGQVHDNNEN